MRAATPARPCWAVLAAAVAWPAAALSANGERWLDTPTGWSYLLGATPTQVGSQALQGRRVFNLERVGTSDTYDLITVSNSGVHAASGTAIVYNRTLAELQAHLADNQHRLLDLEVDGSTGTERFTAITVPNSGDTAVSAWSWVVRRSTTQLASWFTQNPSVQLVDLEVYALGGTTYYAAVGASLAGARTTSYLINATATEITAALTERNAVLIDIELTTNGGALQPARFAAVMTRAPAGAGAWWYPALTAAEVAERLAQHGGRLVALHRWTSAYGSVHYAASILDNANAETRRIRSLLDASQAGGVTGFKVKQVNGEVIAALNEDYAFEPASTLKIAHSAAVINRVEATDNALDEMRAYHDPCDPDACPDTHNCVTGEQRNLGHVVRRTMRRSDNTATLHLSNLLDDGGTARSGVNDFLAAQGLSSATRLRHNIGCFAPTNNVPFNSLTARDAVLLYERISRGLIFTADWRDVLFNEHMLNWPQDRASGNRPWVRLRALLQEELDATDLTVAERAEFLDRFRLAYKAGGYGWNSPANGYDNVAWLSIAGWSRLIHRQEVLGALSESTRDYALVMFRDWGAADLGADEVYNTFTELLRQPIRRAAQSWDAACTAPTASAPASVTVQEGSDASITMATTGSTWNRVLRWQFFRGTWEGLQDTAGAYSGTATTTLRLVGVETSQAGEYRGLVTNGCGGTATASIVVTVTPVASGEVVFANGFE